MKHITAIVVAIIVLFISFTFPGEQGVNIFAGVVGLPVVIIVYYLLIDMIQNPES